ncbi:MAG: PDZ domain-containing protein [Rhodospirillales bacterium]
MLNHSRLRAVVLTTAIVGLLALWAVPAAAETGFMGLEVQGFDKKVAKILGQNNQSGVLVKNVAMGEAGAIAGFRRGDLIVKLNGSKIKNFESLLKVVLRSKPRQKMPVEVLRNGRKVKLTLVTGTRPPAWKVNKGSFANYPSIQVSALRLQRSPKK